MHPNTPPSFTAIAISGGLLGSSGIFHVILFGYTRPTLLPTNADDFRGEKITSLGMTGTLGLSVESGIGETVRDGRRSRNRRLPDPEFDNPRPNEPEDGLQSVGALPDTW